MRLFGQETFLACALLLNYFVIACNREIQLTEDPNHSVRVNDSIRTQNQSVRESQLIFMGEL